MARGYSISIKIAGQLTDPDAARKLVAAIEKERPGLDWGSAPVSDRTEIVEAILDAADSGAILLLTDESSPESHFPAIEAACLDAGLWFVSTQDPDAEYEFPGRRIVNAPSVSDEPFVLHGSDEALPLVDATDLSRLADKEGVDRVMSLLRTLVDLPKAMPAALTVSETVATELRDELERTTGLPPRI